MSKQITVNISIIYTNLIALFTVAIYIIYNICSEKDIFNGLSAKKWQPMQRRVQVFCGEGK